MIRHDDSIKGIYIDDIHLKICQYADDTVFILDGSEKSLRNALNLLDFFFRISGLRVNIDKTTAIWIGSHKHSNLILLPDQNLHWVNGLFKILGIIFSRDLDDMVDLNYKIAYDSIKKILCSWSNRSLTPLGRITVIKSLAMSKLNYYCLTLPNPPICFIDNINKLFYDFIWNGKPDKIKRKQLCNGYDYGGLKMIDIRNFIQALKLSWIRKMYHLKDNWVLLFRKTNNLGDVYKTCIQSIEMSLPTISNKFWYDVFGAWIKLNNSLSPKNEDEFLRMRLWDNPLIKIGDKPIVFPELKKIGIFFVNDLFNDNGSFYDYNTFCNVFNVNLNFLHYMGLKSTLNTIFDLRRIRKKLSMPVRPLIFDVLLKSTKGCQDFYRALKSPSDMDNSETRGKWERDMSIVIPDNDWKIINKLPFKLLKSTKLRWFQYRLTNRILGTNTLLKKMGIQNSDLCNFCGLLPETYEHIFIHCNKIHIFIMEVKNWIFEKTKFELHLYPKSIILGITNNIEGTSALNFILLIMKHYIYWSKIENKNPNLYTFKLYLKQHWESEKYANYLSNNNWNFDKEWGPWISLFSYFQQ